MNTIKNSVSLIGNLGSDITIKAFDSGSKKASVSLATTSSYKNSSGEYINTTQWHNIVAWGKTAELMASSLQKGSKVAVQGSIAYRTYEDSSRNTRTMTEILVDSFYKLDASPVIKEKISQN